MNNSVVMTGGNNSVAMIDVNNSVATENGVASIQGWNVFLAIVYSTNLHDAEYRAETNLPALSAVTRACVFRRQCHRLKK